MLYSKRQIVAMIRGIKVLRKIGYDLLVVIMSQKMPKQQVAANKNRSLALQEHQHITVASSKTMPAIAFCTAKSTDRVEAIFSLFMPPF